MTLPDSPTMLAMAGVGLDVPNDEETKRLLNLEKKRQSHAAKPRQTFKGQTGQSASRLDHQNTNRELGQIELGP